MAALAMRLAQMASQEKTRGPANRPNGTDRPKWYRGGGRCTARFEREQQAACRGEGFDLWEKLFGSDCPS